VSEFTILVLLATPLNEVQDKETANLQHIGFWWCRGVLAALEKIGIEVQARISSCSSIRNLTVANKVTGYPCQHIEWSRAEIWGARQAEGL